MSQRNRTPPATTLARQVAVIAVRRVHDGFDVCLIRRKQSEKWAIPKGFIDRGTTAEQAALAEAFEEAGVKGRIIGEVIGTYDYKKWNASLRVAVYLMEVLEEQEHWRESRIRDRSWRSLEEVRALLASHPVLTLWDRTMERLTSWANATSEDGGS